MTKAFETEEVDRWGKFAMSYTVVRGPEAKEDYAKLPPLVQSHLLDEIDRRAEDLVQHSVKSRFPYRVGGQMFRAEPYRAVDKVCYIYALFKLPVERKSDLPHGDAVADSRSEVMWTLAL